MSIIPPALLQLQWQLEDSRLFLHALYTQRWSHTDYTDFTDYIWFIRYALCITDNAI
ncbi:MAG: hypothetical protein PWP64_642 [Candidatus Cloacimonadota bacterium]|nr:hypothetical protein [Candidatus Cloacimonadota bacterium]